MRILFFILFQAFYHSELVAHKIYTFMPAIALNQEKRSATGGNTLSLMKLILDSACIINMQK